MSSVANEDKSAPNPKEVHAPAQTVSGRAFKPDEAFLLDFPGVTALEDELLSKVVIGDVRREDELGDLNDFLLEQFDQSSANSFEFYEVDEGPTNILHSDGRKNSLLSENNGTLEGEITIGMNADQDFTLNEQEMEILSSLVDDGLVDCVKPVSTISLVPDIISSNGTYPITLTRERRRVSVTIPIQIDDENINGEDLRSWAAEKWKDPETLRHEEEPQDLQSAMERLVHRMKQSEISQQKVNSMGITIPSVKGKGVFTSNRSRRNSNGGGRRRSFELKAQQSREQLLKLVENDLGVATRRGSQSRKHRGSEDAGSLALAAQIVAEWDTCDNEEPGLCKYEDDHSKEPPMSEATLKALEAYARKSHEESKSYIRGRYSRRHSSPKL